MTGEVRWGILGTGLIAGVFAGDLRTAGMTVTAVGSRSAASAQRFASEHGIPTAHGSYEALAADPTVDVIYVATPHPMHAPNGRLALEHGKHILVEKAFTMNQREAGELVDLGAARGLVVQEAMWTRFLPHMRRLREIIAAGTLGELRTVIADHGQLLPSDPSHRLQDPALGGGALLDLGIYPVSFAWDVFGAPSTVLAHASRTATGVDRQTAMIFGYEGGQQALLHAELDASSPTTAQVIGTRARIELERTWYAPTTLRVLGPDGSELERFESQLPGRGMQYQAFAVESAIREGRDSSVELPAKQSVAIMGTLDEVRRQIGLRYPADEETADQETAGQEPAC